MSLVLTYVRTETFVVNISGIPGYFLRTWYALVCTYHSLPYPTQYIHCSHAHSANKKNALHNDVDELN